MIRPTIAVANGTAAIPDKPGLGVELDSDALEKYRIAPLAHMPDPPEALMTGRWPTGSTCHFADKTQYWSDSANGKLPLLTKGVQFEYIDNDDSREWKELQQRAKQGTVLSKERTL